MSAVHTSVSESETESSQTSLLELNNVSRYYGEHAAVHDINLSISKGEVIGLLGLNGAGKSTILKMISGSIAPSLGEVLFDGQNVQALDVNSKARIGYLPEQPPLYLQQRVDEYLYHVGKLYGLSKTDAQARVGVVKQQCGLDDVSQRVIGNLSKGYQQRLGIAQAILHEPDLIILDEPTVGLDPQQLLKVRDLVKELAKKSAVIFSSHILSEVQAVADRIVILHQGQIVHDAVNNDTDALEKLFSDVIFGRKAS